MTTRHHLSSADETYIGSVYNENYQSGRRGLRLSHVFTHEFGAITTLDADGICVNVTATAATTLSATGALVSGGVATLDVARALTITPTATTTDLSGINFTLSGTDTYGVAMTETLAGGNGVAVTGAKAFKTVTSVATDGAITGNLHVGTSNKFGLPIRLADKGKLLGVFCDGVPETTLTVVAGLAATGTSTATTADVRGTVTPNTAANGSKRFTAVIVPDGRSVKANVFGPEQA